MNAEPKVNTLQLVLGGEVSFTEVEPHTYVFRVEYPGGQFSIHLTGLDVMGLRSLTGDLIRDAFEASHEVAPDVDAERPPYTGDEPLGCCPAHGHYWTDDCTRCGR